jgi:lantibiotic modifying enzyme
MNNVKIGALPQIKDSVASKCTDIYEVLTCASRSSKDLSLGTGIAGILLYQAYYCKYINPDVYNDVIQSIQRLIDLSPNNGKVGFLDGPLGVGWVLSHLNNIELLEMDDEAFCHVDAYASNFTAWTSYKNYDLLYGTIGSIIYLSERGRMQSACKVLEDSILVSKIEQNENSIYWYDDVLLQHFDKCCINYGVAHGIPSILRVLSMFNDYTCDISLALKRGLEYFLSLPAGKVSRFCASSLNSDTSRLGWCYGDLGVSVILLNISNELSDTRLFNTSLDICRGTLSRLGIDDGIEEAGLCHGSTGAAVLYKRAFELSGDRIFQAASTNLIERTLEFGMNNEGICGYASIQESGEKTKFDYNDTSLLSGLTGIGLGLIDFYSGEQSEWSKVLLIR